MIICTHRGRALIIPWHGKTIIWSESWIKQLILVAYEHVPPTSFCSTRCTTSLVDEGCKNVTKVNTRFQPNWNPKVRHERTTIIFNLKTLLPNKIKRCVYLASVMDHYSSTKTSPFAVHVCGRQEISLFIPMPRNAIVDA